MDEIKEMQKKLSEQEKLVRSFSSFIASFSTQEELATELVVNHNRKKKKSKVIMELYNLAITTKTGRNLLRSTEELATKSLKKEVDNRIQKGKYTSKIYREGDIGVVIPNSYKIVCNYNNLTVKLRVNINVPRATHIKDMYKSRLNNSTYGILVPFNWGKGFYTFDNLNANLTICLISISDPDEIYITEAGSILGAKKYYESILEQYNQLPWFRRWYYLPPLEYAEWLKHQKIYKYPVNNISLYQKIEKDKKLQQSILTSVEGTLLLIEKNFNIVWHEVLNYPALKFGKSHITFREDL